MEDTTNPKGPDVKNDWKQKLKDAWNENPKECIAVAAAVTVSVAKVIDSVSASRSRKAYSRMMNRKYR